MPEAHPYGAARVERRTSIGAPSTATVLATRAFKGNRSSWSIVCTGVTGSHGPRRRADVEYDDSTASLSLVTDTGPDADEALGLLHARSYAGLVRLAVVLGNDEGRAEELVQDAYVRVLGRRHQIRDLGVAEAYLRRTVVNLCRDSWRRRLVANRFRPDPPRPEPSAEDAALLTDQQRRLLEILDLLPKRQREVVVLRFYEDLSVSDTARLLGISEGAVKAYSHRAMSALRSAVEG
jgi:RNA polymerase sigma-70 factor (sigma-E family)